MSIAGIFHKFSSSNCKTSSKQCHTGMDINSDQEKLEILAYLCGCNCVKGRESFRKVFQQLNLLRLGSGKRKNSCWQKKRIQTLQPFLFPLRKPSSIKFWNWKCTTRFFSNDKGRWQPQAHLLWPRRYLCRQELKRRILKSKVSGFTLSYHYGV